MAVAVAGASSRFAGFAGFVPIQPAQGVPELDAWGSVTDLGATLLAGDGLISGRMTFGEPTSAVSAGYFACTQGKFEMVYPFDEQALVVEGEATLRDARTGVAVRYRAGDGWFVEKGTPVIWEIHSARFVKHYLAVA
ncbi:MAG: hypothetical protein GAK40_01121 [Burkholderia plantarii]|nr:MAG: hypothetical protein GAK40_01121 [Burkholderia plantarii]